jgi:hypothetical protein
LVAVAGAGLQLTTIAVGHRQTVGEECNIEKPPLQCGGNFDPIVRIEEPAELALRIAPEGVAVRAVAGDEKGGETKMGSRHVCVGSIQRMARRYQSHAQRPTNL